MKIRLLGTGASVGVPIIGCECIVCQSNLRFNKRQRCALLITANNKKILIDFGADIRRQLLQAELKSLDAAIITHDHADHVNGIDELKVFSFHTKKPLPLYGEKHVIESLKQRFSWMFASPDPHEVWGKERLHPITLIRHEKTEICNLDFYFFPQKHGIVESLGVRIGDFVYANDVIDFPEESEKYLQNTKILIIDCLDYKSSFGHAGLDKVIIWHKKFNPQKTILINMGHTIDYYKIKKQLPENIVPSFDGMEIEL